MGGRPWSDAEDGVLIEMWWQERPASEIAAALGCRYDSLVSRKAALGLPPSAVKRRPPKGTPWTPEQDALLTRLWMLGVDAREIRKELTPIRTRLAINRRRCDLKLPPRKVKGEEKTVRVSAGLPDVLHRAMVRRLIERRQTEPDYIRSLILRDTQGVRLRS